MNPRYYKVSGRYWLEKWTYGVAHPCLPLWQVLECHDMQPLKLLPSERRPHFSAVPPIQCDIFYDIRTSEYYKITPGTRKGFLRVGVPFSVSLEGLKTLNVKLSLCSRALLLTRNTWISPTYLKLEISGEKMSWKYNSMSWVILAVLRQFATKNSKLNIDN